MPELAEVEYHRTCWNCGLGHEITAIKLHAGKRLFRSIESAQLQRLVGTVLEDSEARGKQLLFHFSTGQWLGLHLGMTGKLLVAEPDFELGKHDHLVLYQAERALVFHDPRLFGAVQFASGENQPDWWTKLPPSITSRAFTQARMEQFIARHARLAIKPLLLLQAGFPGIGNWMADEILWRAKIHPLVPGACLGKSELAALWRSLHFVCRGAMRTVARDFSDPPPGWLFHERWGAGGKCPIHHEPLQRETIGGRTTAWCAKCQRARERKLARAARRSRS